MNVTLVPQSMKIVSYALKVSPAAGGRHELRASYAIRSEDTPGACHWLSCMDRRTCGARLEPRSRALGIQVDEEAPRAMHEEGVVAGVPLEIFEEGLSARRAARRLLKDVTACHAEIEEEELGITSRTV